jgi:hypothetical protein
MDFALWVGDVKINNQPLFIYLFSLLLDLQSTMISVQKSRGSNSSIQQQLTSTVHITINIVAVVVHYYKNKQKKDHPL